MAIIVLIIPKKNAAGANVGEISLFSSFKWIDYGEINDVAVFFFIFPVCTWVIRSGLRFYS